VKRAFAHLNLTRNPFGEPRPSERADLAVVDVDEHVERLRAGGCYIEFTGRQGRGKTTRLHAIGDRIADAAFIRVPEPPEHARKTKLPRASVVLVDDAQFLNARQRRTLFERADAVAAATHDSLAAEAESADFEVREVEIAGLERRRLREIVDKRIQWARRGPGAVPELSDSALDRLIELYGDDLRTIEDVLYSVFQSLEAVELVEHDHIERADVPEFVSQRG
jgi:hypothetical protein